MRGDVKEPSGIPGQGGSSSGVAPDAHPLRVLHLTNACCLDGTGITNSTTDLAIEQARRGNRVTIACFRADPAMRRLYAEHGVTLDEGEIDGGSSRSMVQRLMAVRRLIRAADVVHVHTVKTTALAFVVAPVRCLRRSVSTVHNPHQRSVIVMYVARRIVSLSAANRRHVHRLTLGLRQPVAIMNGILGSARVPPVVDIVPVELPGHSIVFVGALHERKGLDVLIRAMPAVLATVPDARLFVLGNRDNPEFEALAGGLGLGGVVRFVGFVEDPRTYMRSAAVFVLPSRAEGFGNVITEARACGVPIIASRVGGIPEALSGGAAGLLVPPDDVDALAAEIGNVLTDSTLAARLREATAVGLDDMRVERAERQYREVYDSLPGRTSGSKGRPAPAISR